MNGSEIKNKKESVATYTCRLGRRGKERSRYLIVHDGFLDLYLCERNRGKTQGGSLSYQNE